MRNCHSNQVREECDPEVESVQYIRTENTARYM